MLIWYQCLFFGHVSAKVFCSFLIRLFSYWWILRVLSIFWITAIYKHFFFQFVSCLFILLTVFYRVETVSLSRVQFINYLFHRSHFGLIPKKTLPYARSSRFSRFFLEVLYFCLLHVGLWSIFHSFLWVGAKSIFRFAFFFFFARGCLVSPASFVEKTLSLLHYIAFAPLWNSSWLYLCRSIYRLAILFHWSFLQIPHCLINIAWSQVVSVFCLCFILSILSWVSYFSSQYKL